VQRALGARHRPLFGFLRFRLTVPSLTGTPTLGAWLICALRFPAFFSLGTTCTGRSPLAPLNARRLTNRSSRPATAASVSPVGGTLYIFANRAYAACLRGRLSSNVRPHMHCDCPSYAPIELDRKSVSRRIKESKSLRKRLSTIAQQNSIKLLTCASCGQYWQSGREWNFANEEYFFQVPKISIEDWLSEQYAQPAALMVYSSAMNEYLKNADLTRSEQVCKKLNCGKHAVRHSVLCAEHHIESLQRGRQLPPTPIGKLFPPYYSKNAA
jgi:hypothetical protein